jgi:hypothetical protein
MRERRLLVALHTARKSLAGANNHTPTIITETTIRVTVAVSW